MMTPLVRASRALSSSATARAHLLPGCQLLVCDMAGTTVEEAGLVYTTLQECMNDRDLGVSDADMEPWHGAGKSEVVGHFAARAQMSAAASTELETAINAEFEDRLEAKYMARGSPLALIDDALPAYFERLRTAGVKIGLNTGYPHRLQDAILDKLNLAEMVDAYTSAQEVPCGRPSPYMVHSLMAKTGVQDVRLVAKAGDTERDIGEGLNAGCGQVIGVLSGADNAACLEAAGAHTIVGNITDLALNFHEHRCAIASHTTKAWETEVDAGASADANAGYTKPSSDSNTDNGGGSTDNGTGCSGSGGPRTVTVTTTTTTTTFH